LEAAEAKKKYPELYTSWREDPANFNVDGIYPIRELWVTAREAWREILSTPVTTSLIYVYAFYYLNCTLNPLILTVSSGGKYFDCHPQVNSEGTRLHSTWTWN